MVAGEPISKSNFKVCSVQIQTIYVENIINLFYNIGRKDQCQSNGAPCTSNKRTKYVVNMD